MWREHQRSVDAAWKTPSWRDQQHSSRPGHPAGRMLMVFETNLLGAAADLIERRRRSVTTARCIAALAGDGSPQLVAGGELVTRQSRCGAAVLLERGLVVLPVAGRARRALGRLAL